MRKFLSFILIFSILAFPAFAVDEWTKGNPSGSISPATIDTSIQANNNAIDRFLSYGRHEALISYSSSTTIIVGVGSVVCSNSDGSVRRTRYNDSSTSVTFSNLDTGTEAASTTYYVYAVADTDVSTFTITISESSSSPTGVTYYKKLGSFYNDSSSDIVKGKITNDSIPSLAGTYDSGWFAVSTSSTYTKTHNLGTTNVLAKIWFSDSSTGASNVFEVYVRGPNDIGGQLYDLTTTSVKIYTDASGVAQKITSGGGVTSYTSGYYRIVALSLD